MVVSIRPHHTVEYGLRYAELGEDFKVYLQDIVNS